MKNAGRLNVSAQDDYQLLERKCKQMEDEIRKASMAHTKLVDINKKVSREADEHRAQNEFLREVNADIKGKFTNMLHIWATGDFLFFNLF